MKHLKVRMDDYWRDLPVVRCSWSQLTVTLVTPRSKLVRRLCGGEVGELWLSVAWPCEIGKGFHVVRHERDGNNVKIVFRRSKRYESGTTQG